MKKKNSFNHPVAELSSLLLFGVFVLFLLLMLLFSARIYQQSINNTNSESTLGTAVSYIAEKFRRHDTAGGIYISELEDVSALCFLDTINDQDYITYLYLDQGKLKELFTPKDSSAGVSAGTAIAELSDFEIDKNSQGFFHLTLKTSTGKTEEFYLHQNSYSEEAS